MAAQCLISTGLPVDWNAVSAVSTALAAIIALWASIVAVRKPAKDRAQDRSESTAEILRASGEAVALFEAAEKLGALERSELAQLVARAGSLLVALDRLLNRPSLTDGAIITGAGAMQLLNAIIEQSDAYKNRGQEGLARFVSNHLAPSKAIQHEVEARAIRVASYACDRNWPRSDWFEPIKTSGLVKPQIAYLPKQNEPDTPARV